MKTTQNKIKGFTLVEMTVVIVIGMALAGAGLMLLNQQLRTVSIFNQQNFILRQAPSINRTLTALLDRADAIRLHNNFSDAIGDQNPVLTDGKTLVAAYRNIDNSVTFGIISEETNSGVTSLNYYFFDPSSSEPTPSVDSPSWVISRDIGSADFSLIEGLFQTTLTGPANEQITYTISPNQ